MKCFFCKKKTHLNFNCQYCCESFCVHCLQYEIHKCSELEKMKESELNKLETYLQECKTTSVKIKKI